MPSIPIADPHATRPVTAVGGRPGTGGPGARHAAVGYPSGEGAGPTNAQRVRPYVAGDPRVRFGPAAPPPGQCAAPPPAVRSAAPRPAGLDPVPPVEVPRQRQGSRVAQRVTRRPAHIPPAAVAARPAVVGPRSAAVEARSATKGPRPAPARRESHRAVPAGPTRAQGILAAGVALSGYLTRTVSMLGLLAVVGIISGTAPDGGAPAAPDSSVSSSPTPRR